MGDGDPTGTLQTRLCGRVAVIAGIALIVLICWASGMYVAAFVISSPMTG
jgi:hypothetical protein